MEKHFPRLGGNCVAPSLMSQLCIFGNIYTNIALLEQVTQRFKTFSILENFVYGLKDELEIVNVTKQTQFLLIGIFLVEDSKI